MLVLRPIGHISLFVLFPSVRDARIAVLSEGFPHQSNYFLPIGISLLVRQVSSDATQIVTVFVKLFDRIVTEAYFIHLFRYKTEYLPVVRDDLIELVVKGFALVPHLVYVYSKV